MDEFLGGLLSLAYLVLSVVVDIKVLFFIRRVNSWMRHHEIEQAYKNGLHESEIKNEKNG